MQYWFEKGVITAKNVLRSLGPVRDVPRLVWLAGSEAGRAPGRLAYSVQIHALPLLREGGHRLRSALGSHS